MLIGPIDRAANLNPWRHRALAEKVLAGLGFLALAVTLPPWPGAALVAGVMAALTLWGAKVPLRLWLSAMALPVGFMLTGAATLLVQIDAQGLSLAPGGMAAAGGLVLRAFAATACLLFLALTTPAVQLLSGLRRLGVPSEIVEIALLTYRFVFLLADAALAMTNAQRARLGHATPRLWLRSTGQVIANLLPRAMDRARRMELGLAARGWQGDMPVLTLRRAVSWRFLALVLGLQLAVASAGVML